MLFSCTGKLLLRQMLQEAKYKGHTVNVRHAKILFCGASRAGKTSFSRLLRNQEHEVACESTPTGYAEQVLISGKINVVGNCWVNLDSKSETQELTKRLIRNIQSKKYTDIPKLSTKSSVPLLDNSIPAYKDESSDQTITTTADTDSSVNLPDVMLKENKMESLSLVPEDDDETLIVSDISEELPDDILQSTKQVGVIEQMVSYFNVPCSENTPKTWDLFTFLDTGGQPQFINMLPAINVDTAITFIVLNISNGLKCLNDSVKAQYTCKGYNYSEYTLKYTNLHLLRCLLSSVKIAALKKDYFDLDILKKVAEAKQSHPVVCFIGTFADVLIKQVGEKYNEEVKKINVEIKKLVDTVKNEDVLEFWVKRDKEYIITVDNTVPREQHKDDANEDIDLQTIQHLTNENVKKIREHANKALCNKAQYEIPISWLILELELRSSDKDCIPLSEVEAICDAIMPLHRKMTKAQIVEVLKFFHLHGMLLYFSEVDGMKDVVITNPQWLFNNLTKIIMCKFESNASDLYGAYYIEEMHNGICHMELLERLKLDYQGIELESFIELLVYLKIITPMVKGYFMPTILPLSGENITFSEKEYGKPAFFAVNGEYIDPVEPLLIEFTFGTIPRGLFGFLIVQLLHDNADKFELYGENDNTLYRYVDLMSFFMKPYYYISLHDKTSYLELQIRVKGTKPSCHYAVQTTVTKALKKVCDKFDWNFDDCRYGFLCDEHTEGSQAEHLTLLDANHPLPNQIPEYAYCKRQQTTCLNKAHGIWLEVC